MLVNNNVNRHNRVTLVCCGKSIIYQRICGVLNALEDYRIAIRDRCITGNRLANLESQDGDAIHTQQVQRIANGCIRSVRSTSEEVCLALLDSSGIAYLHLHRSRSLLYLERQDNDAILARQMQRIANGCIRSVRSTSEEVCLALLDSSGIAYFYLIHERQYDRTIADEVDTRQGIVIRTRGSQLLATE